MKKKTKELTILEIMRKFETGHATINEKIVMICILKEKAFWHPEKIYSKTANELIRKGYISKSFNILKIEEDI
jgi:hypothetical protein